MKCKNLLLLTSWLLTQSAPVWAMELMDDIYNNSVKPTLHSTPEEKRGINALDAISLSSMEMHADELSEDFGRGENYRAFGLSDSTLEETLLDAIFLENETMSDPNSSRNLPEYLRKKLNNNLDLNSLMRNKIESTKFFETFEELVDSSIKGIERQLIKKIDPEYIFLNRFSALQYIINKNVDDSSSDLFRSYYLDMHFDAFKNARLPSNFNIAAWFILSASDCFDKGNSSSFLLKTLQENMKSSPLTDPAMMCSSYVLVSDQDANSTNTSQQNNKIIKDYFAKNCGIGVNENDDFLNFFKIILDDSISVIDVKLKEISINTISPEFPFNFHILRNILNVSAPYILKRPTLTYYFDVLLEKIFEIKEPSKIFELFSSLRNQANACFQEPPIVPIISGLLENHILNLVENMTENDSLIENNFNYHNFKESHDKIINKLDGLFKILSAPNTTYLAKKANKIVKNDRSINTILLIYLRNNSTILIDKYKTQRTYVNKGMEYFLGTSSAIKEAYKLLLCDAKNHWNDFITDEEIDIINQEYQQLFATEDKALEEAINNGKNTITSFPSSSATVIVNTFDSIKKSIGWL